MANLYVSAAWADRAFARELASRLSQAGHSVTLDELQPLSEILGMVRVKLIADADRIVVICSAAGSRSHKLRTEAHRIAISSESPCFLVAPGVCGSLAELADEQHLDICTVEALDAGAAGALLEHLRGTLNAEKPSFGAAYCQSERLVTQGPKERLKKSRLFTLPGTVAAITAASSLIGLIAKIFGVGLAPVFADYVQFYTFLSKALFAPLLAPVEWLFAALKLPALPDGYFQLLTLSFLIFLAKARAFFLGYYGFAFDADYRERLRIVQDHLYRFRAGGWRFWLYIVVTSTFLTLSLLRVALFPLALVHAARVWLAGYRGEEIGGGAAWFGGEALHRWHSAVWTSALYHAVGYVALAVGFTITFFALNAYAVSPLPDLEFETIVGDASARSCAPMSPSV